MTTADELRKALGRLGIWMPPPAAAGVDAAAFAREIEDAGFRSVWFRGVNDPASLDAIEPFLSETKSLYVGSGIASVWHWDPADLAARADRLSAAYEGRFILGLGASHAPVVEPTGQVYVKPFTKTREFVGALPETAAPIILAALGPKMLELARDKALGAHPYFTPVEHTAFARQTLGPVPLLIPELAVALKPGAEGEAAARAYAEFYLRLPNYTNNLRKFGFTDTDLAGDGSQKLINAIVPNAPANLTARVRQHLDAGADHVVVQLIGEGGRFAPGDLGELASLVGDLL
jgi:probable F420-dependent oxidoreductase